MKTKLFRFYFSIFFLLAFASGKAFGYHTLLHDHDNQQVHCEICDLSLIQQLGPANISETINIEFQSSFCFKRNLLNSSQKTYSYKVLGIHCSRPPPFLN